MIKLCKNFYLKDRNHNDVTSGVVYNVWCRLCSESHYGAYVRNLNVRIGELVGISPLTSVSNDDFSIPTRENKTF